MAFDYFRYTTRLHVDAVKLAMARRATDIVLSEKLDIAIGQIDALRAQPDLSVREIQRQRDSDISRIAGANPARVWIQSRWDTEETEMRSLIALLRDALPTSRIIYLDWFAPLDLRNKYLFDLVDAYVKKQVLRNKSLYRHGFHDTNLVEYESQWDNRFLIPRHGGIDEELLEQKLVVGWNFAAADSMRSILAQRYFELTDRRISIHCRIAAPKERNTWYGHMRGRAFDAAANLPVSSKLTTAERISQKAYLKELSQSQLCFSPFGYGEVCWRDFEAIACGAILVKPDMSHIETHPDIYRPFETYIPVAWDFSDLEERCTEVLRNPDQILNMRNRAVEVWNNFLKTGINEVVANAAGTSQAA